MSFRKIEEPGVATAGVGFSAAIAHPHQAGIARGIIGAIPTGSRWIESLRWRCGTARALISAGTGSGAAARDYVVARYR
jgi:hypothetical protein